MSRDPEGFGHAWQAVVIGPDAVIVVDPGPLRADAVAAAGKHPGALVAFRPIRPTPRKRYDDF